MSRTYQVVIIGNGIAGSSAASALRQRSDCSIAMISDEEKLPFARTALMYIFMGQVTKNDTELYPETYWKNNNIDLIYEKVVSLDRGNKAVQLSSGETVQYDTLVLATGSKPVLPHLDGIESQQVHKLYHSSDLEKMTRHFQGDIRKGMIVGGGLIGIELAEMWLSRGIDVTLLIREKCFWTSGLPPAESQMVQQYLSKKGIKFITESTLSSLHFEQQKLSAIGTSQGSIVPCDALGIAIGVEPNVGDLRSSGLVINRGIVVNEYLKTSDESIYAAGDCVEFQGSDNGIKKSEAVWYVAKKMGEAVAKNIAGETKPFERGLWYNSARFLDLDYQIYGVMEINNAGLSNALYWQHPAGDKSLRLAIDDDNRLVGILAIGLRLRQAQCEKWLLEKNTLKEVIDQLPAAHFESEFSKNFMKEIGLHFKNKLNNGIQV